MKLVQKIKRKCYKLFHPAIGEVLMLHRVVEQRSSIAANRQMEIRVDFLEKTIKNYKANGIDIISLDELHLRITQPSKRRKPFVCFTLDDGYRDNYELAYPVFKKHNVPFAIYVANSILDNQLFVWWYYLEEIIKRNPEIHLKTGISYRTQSVDEKNIAFEKIRTMLSGLSGVQLQCTFSELFSDYLSEADTSGFTIGITGVELKMLARDPLCTIAAHTIHHYHLANLPAEEQKYEILQSKLLLEEITAKEIRHFAYPYGSYNDESIQLVKDCGYVTAVLAWGGKVRGGESTYKINRTALVE